MKGLREILIVLILISAHASAQNANKVLSIRTDSTTSTKTPALTKDTLQKIVGKDTLKIIPKHDPRKATLRSAILPGWGQAYNREYWKIPLVYTAIGIPVGFYFYNNSWYKKTKKAYEIHVNNDSTHFPDIDRKLSTLSTPALLYYRNSFRRDRDYSLLYTLVAWGLNVADATVFGHLKDFDVSSDLTLKVKPTFHPSSAGNTTGLSFVLAVKSPSKNRPVILQ